MCHSYRAPTTTSRCKRSFAQHGTQTPYEVSNDGTVMKCHESFRDSKEKKDSEFRNSDPVRCGMDTPIKDLVDAGVDLNDIKSRICTLRNELHPLFKEDNICVCKHENAKLCLHPTYSSVSELTKGTKGSLELNWAPPLENLLLRAMMQLASRIITDKDSLGFWAGIIKAAEGPESEKHHYYVPARRLDTPENALLGKKVLDHLLKVADNIRFHFKAFQDLRYRIWDHMEADQVAFCTVWSDDVAGPERRLAQLSALISAGNGEQPSFDMEQLEAILQPESDDETESDEEPTQVCCGWRDGKCITQETPFPHIFLNLNGMFGYDTSNDDWQRMNISQIRLTILRGADTICHEFAHAMMYIYFPNQEEPHMNTESVAEAGLSFSNHVFGGILSAHTDAQGFNEDLKVTPWPEYKLWSHYVEIFGPLELSDFSKAAMPATVIYYPMNFRWECFLGQSFWDEDGPRWYNAVRKLWLRIHEAHYFDPTMAADETPVANTRDERVRLCDSKMEYQRIVAKRERRREAMKASKVRWDRYCDKAEDKKEEFLDGGGLRVFDEAWAGCTKHCDRNVFL